MATRTRRAKTPSATLPSAPAASAASGGSFAVPLIPPALAWMQAFTRPCDERVIAQRLYRLDVEGQPGVVATNGLIMIAARGESNLEPAPTAYVSLLYRHLPTAPGPDRIALHDLRAFLGLPDPPAPPHCTRCDRAHWDAVGGVVRTVVVRIGGDFIDRDLLAAAVQQLDGGEVFVAHGGPHGAVKFWAPTWRLALMPIVNVSGPYDEIPSIPLERVPA